MQAVGIIVNANSGKDIRRLVSAASVFDDREKINILKRLLLSLDAMGVERALIMPDPVGLVRSALRDLEDRLQGLSISQVDLPRLAGDARDSLRSARTMVGEDCACIVTLGGDGTNRIVASACRDVPLLPISAGTNNVFPYIIEATIAGLAAAAFAHAVTDGQCCRQRPRLDLYRDDEYIDTALVDTVVVDQHLIGARAVWDPALIRELFLTRARPGDIGLSSIGACLEPMPLDSGRGLHIRTGSGGRRVLAPIAPGLIQRVAVAEHRSFEAGEALTIDSPAGVVALDGEREIGFDPPERLQVILNLYGPRVVDIETTLDTAVKAGLLERETGK